MRRRPPTSTLFPYTTLFRSAVQFTIVPETAGTMRRQARARIGGLVSEWSEHPFEWVEDRKSTRLNSSHVEISYAVFCLKKKNNIVLRPDPDLPAARTALRNA